MAEWRMTGSHWITKPDGTREICTCGPANALTGPQWADGVERQN